MLTSTVGMHTMAMGAIEVTVKPEPGLLDAAVRLLFRLEPGKKLQGFCRNTVCLPNGRQRTFKGRFSALSADVA